MLKKIRKTLAIIFFTFITLLFLDFTGCISTWFGWMADIQFLPAILALNIGVIVGLILLTLFFGRIYCSIICPLGIMQDIFSWIAGKRKKNRFTYTSEKRWLRFSVLAFFIILLVIPGVHAIALIIAPYSAYGRIAANLFAPIYQWGNNLLAFFAERANSYTFHTVEVYIKSLPAFIVACVTFIALIILAWRGGRTYCNTICPVGTILGYLAKFSWFKPHIDTEKCNGCKLCARNCKASCINPEKHEIDYSRCVACMDCLNNCHQGAISYTHQSCKHSPTPEINSSRRKFLTLSASLAAVSLLKAQEKKVDGGLAVIEDKKIPERTTSIKPAGSKSLRNFAKRCTACQLCVANCPNGVLRPSTKLENFMQPELSYERGFCRPECTKCSDVCPAGAIVPISREAKSSIQIGHAVWIGKNCVVLSDGVECGNCARKCPTGAILMIPYNPDLPDSPKVPAVNTERCIGCGACENLCPARPFSAIYVEGHEVHRTI